MTKEKFINDNRIYVVVTPVVKTPRGVLELEPGRMMAQASHAVSKAKLEYCLGQKDIKGWVAAFVNNGLTTIALRGRDQKELTHVFNLAMNKGIPATKFFDDNESYYDSKDQFLTAVAIGPVTKDQIVNICDYLPLF